MQSNLEENEIKARMNHLVNTTEREKSIKLLNANKALTRVPKKTESWFSCELWIQALELKINSTITKMDHIKKYTSDLDQIIDLVDDLEEYYFYVMRKLMNITNIANDQEDNVAVHPIYRMDVWI